MTPIYMRRINDLARLDMNWVTRFRCVKYSEPPGGLRALSCGAP